MSVETAEYRFTCVLQNGLHARPASLIAELLGRHSCEVTIAKASAGEPVNALSVLSIVGLDVKNGDACVFRAAGVGSKAALAALAEYIEKSLVAADEAPPPEAPKAAAELPIALKRLGVPCVAGKGVCGGVGFGAAVCVQGMRLSRELEEAKAKEPEVELAIAKQTISAVKENLERRAKDARARVEADLLKAHAQIAGDPMLWTEIDLAVRGGKTAAQAMVAASESFIAKLRGAASAYIRDRVVDVQDVCMQLLDNLTGGELESMNVSLSQESVVFAEVLTANQLLGMKRELIAGLVMGGVGATSHTVILARSLRIPAVIDVANVSAVAHAGEGVIVDGDAGLVFVQAAEPVVRHYQRHRKTQERWVQRRVPAAMQPAMTTDDVRLEVGANASLAGEVTAAMERGADGVGLLRTELLFLDRAAEPSEEEQFDAYGAVVRAAAGRPVIIRTFDIGGDKPATYLAMPEEENPFLGVRGLRLYERYPDLLRKQLRAILRASAIGPVKIMAPMVALPSEAAWFKGRVREAESQLRSEGVAIGADVPVGVMIEIPAAALAMEGLCEEVDFFSIGTNDLCQYWMAVDRGNKGVANLYSARHPSFVRLLKMIVDVARLKEKWIGICGEMAGDILHLPLMVGLGFNEISVAPGEVLKLKTAVSGLNAAECRKILSAACVSKDAAGVEHMLRAAVKRGPAIAKLFDKELVELQSDARSKEEVIKEAVDLLYIAGRTDTPRDLEAAVWAREETYTTGFGHGFAVPHCKSDFVSAPTLAVIRLNNPVEWGSIDGLPVNTVMLLTVPASEAAGGGAAGHMKVLQKLARRLMNEEFRVRMNAARDCDAIEACLRDEVGLD